ncbi:MAG TPA: hypothetical protein VFL14_03555 [Xanthomonadales bacterium]|nr:hypothetical protein [Xanthomonadales bacterium]
MNEPLPPPIPGSAPPPPTPPPYRAPKSPVASVPGRGSLLKGLVLGWVVIVGGYVVLGMIAAGLGSMNAFNSGAGEMLLVLFGVAPWLGLVAWLVYYVAQGEPRTAAGFALAVVSMLAVGVLLVAACFALLAGTNWH